MKNIHLLCRSLGYKILESYKKPPYPINLTLSVTNRCNSKCKTCKIWAQKEKKDLSLKEWKNILSSLGNSSYFITVSGGEPFLNDNLVEIIRIISAYNKPKILNIASNGILTEDILNKTQKILDFYHGDLTLNLSLDGRKEVHNYIRGLDCFDNVLDTFHSLKTLRNVSVGIHSVISRYNVHDFIDFYKFVKSELKPASHIVELAENRVEMNNLKEGIAPPKEDYLRIINNLKKECPLFPIRYFLRNKYYLLTKEIITKNEGIRCYAGIASAHIASDGELWACCMRCESLGNLKKKRFQEVWWGKKAFEIRKSIRKRNCFCNLANVNFTNLALNWKKLFTL